MKHPLNSNELFERSKLVTPGGVHSPVRAFKSVGGTPVFFKSANGAEMFSVEGQRYIDFCQSFGPLVLGHRDPEVMATVQETIGLAWTFGACEPYSLELAEWITSRIPWVEKVRFVNSGTEAVMSALRVARAATGKNKVLKFDGCYHGHVDSLLVKAGSGLAGDDTASDSAGVSSQTAQDTIVAPLDNEAEFNRIFDRQKTNLAAVIVEPLPANYGLLIQRKEFLKNIADRCKEAGVLLIFDEVISGFRVGLKGMAGVLGIEPDLVTYGKIMGGGFPVGAYGGRHKYMDLVAPSGPVYQAGTLSANPVGMRAGLATLMKCERDGVWKSLEAKARHFAANLNREFNAKDLNLQVSHFESIFWLHEKVPSMIRSLKDIPVTHGPGFKRVFHAALSRGVYLAPSGYEVGFIGAAHTTELLDEATEKILAAAESAHATSVGERS